MNSIKKVIIMLLVALIGTSCASSYSFKTYNESNVLAQKNKKKTQLKRIEDIPKFNHLRDYIAPGFLFSLYHPSDEKLRGNFRVGVDSYLRLPYGVKVKVSRKTFSKVKEEVLSKYKKFFQRGVKNVTLKLKYRQYYVEIRGLVKKSGLYLVSRKESIDKIIDKAGGLNGDLKKDFFTASIRQKRKSYSISLNQYFESNFFENAFTWTGGDSIFISVLDEQSISNSVPMVSILGGVINPGKVMYKKEANLFYYLSKSGGTISDIQYAESYLIRNTDEGLKKYQFNITDMSTIPQIQANDIIMLNGEKQTPMDKFLGRIASVASLLGSIALLMLAL